MTKIFKTILLPIYLLAAVTSCKKESTFVQKAGEIKVCINKIVDHEALNETVRGITDTLQASGRAFKVTVESSQGNAILARQLTDKYIGQGANVIIGIGTVAAQSFIRYANDGQTRLVFSSVTDPKAAGLTGKPQVSGVSNFVEIAPQIDLFLEILPTLKRLGFLYNPGEANSVALISDLKNVLTQKGITLVLQAATKTSEVQQAMENLVSKVDAVFISNDNTALSAFKCIVNVATKNKIPVFVSDTDIVYKGAIAALGPNQYKIGVQTANLVLEQHSSKAFISKIEYPRSEDTLLVVNQDAAQKCGIVLADSVLKKAQKVLKAT
ncbi:MAG: ABC transporter substrate-binding protein [Holosporales bacterium]|jgi:putative ABC transport system substrate-binding protein|nr:ABC transporter substrate-binding protein [Holosporales bacterium]